MTDAALDLGTLVTRLGPYTGLTIGVYRPSHRCISGRRTSPKLERSSSAVLWLTFSTWAASSRSDLHRSPYTYRCISAYIGLCRCISGRRISPKLEMSSSAVLWLSFSQEPPRSSRCIPVSLSGV
jgi:hypothetical protein